MLTRSLDLPPDWDKPHTSQEFNFFRLCSPELRAFAAIRYLFVTLVTPHHASHTRNVLRRERIARSAYPMSPCFVVIRVLDWTRTCVRCARQRGTFHHTRACFRIEHSPIHNPSQSIKHTQRARQMERSALVPSSVKVVLHEARCHARFVFPRDRHDATSYHAFARDTEPRRLAPRRAHECQMLHARTGTNALFATCAHPVDHIREPCTRITWSSAYWIEFSHGSCVRFRVGAVLSVWIPQTDVSAFGSRGRMLLMHAYSSVH